MSTWLPFPTWDGLHPLIIHFPVALLLVAPLFVVLGLYRPPQWRLFSVAALILMVLGTAGAYLAVETGEAAAGLVDRTPQLTTAIQEHQAMAEDTRQVFTFLSVFFALLLAAPRFIKALPPRRLAALYIFFLVLYLASCLVLARTAHLGGRLVHHFGVQAMINDPGAPPLDK